jgi:hypothetical protein
MLSARPQIRYTTQPQVPVGIDWSHPISRGLVFYYLPTVGGALAPRDLVRNRVGTVIGTALNLIGSTEGKTLPFNGATSYSFPRDTFLEPPNTVSFMVFVAHGLSSGNSQPPLCKTFSNNGGPPYVGYDIETNGSVNSYQPHWAQASALVNGPAVSLTNIKAPTLMTVTISVPSVTGGASVYENATLRGSGNTGAGLLTYDTTSTGNLILSGSGGGGSVVQPWSGQIFMAAVWSRVLSPAEVAQMWAGSPFQILTPLRVPQFPVQTLPPVGSIVGSMIVSM